MKFTKTKIATFAFVISSAVSLLPAQAGSLAVRNCTWCHGPSAQGYWPAPRLAGQRYRYIERQLKSFARHRRDNPFSRMYMWYAAANLTHESAHALAFYFASLHPKAANDGNRDLVAKGRAIYQQGVPSDNVAACVACHGPRAQGIGGIPRLGGLSYSYLQDRLAQWHDGYDAAALHPMPHVASQLAPNQIAALASYLSFLK
ncbi:MAG: c-type cytochrome [Pseudolabrys sp.]